VLLQADPYQHAKAKEVSRHVADDLAYELAYEVAHTVAYEAMHELDYELNGGGAQGSTRRLMALLSGTGERSLCTGTGERSLCTQTSGGSMEAKIDDHQEMTTNIVRQGLSLRPYPASFTSWGTSILPRPRSAQRKGHYGLAAPRGPAGRTAMSSCRGSMQLPLDASVISEKSDDEEQTSLPVKRLGVVSARSYGSDMGGHPRSLMPICCTSTGQIMTREDHCHCDINRFKSYLSIQQPLLNGRMHFPPCPESIASMCMHS